MFFDHGSIIFQKCDRFKLKNTSFFKILFLHNQVVQKHADGGFDRKNLETFVSGRKLHDSKKRRACAVNLFGVHEC